MATRKEEITTTSSTQHREQQQFVNRTLDSTKDNIQRATDEARREIPRYTQAVNDYQEHTAYAVREIADSYIESQKEIINSFQSAWVPFIENAYGIFYRYWLSPRRISEVYARIVGGVADNTIAATRLANNTVFANMEAFRSSMQRAKENAKELSRIGVNAAKTLEQISRDNIRDLTSSMSNT